MSTQKIKVFLVDDHRALRDGLGTLLNDSGDFLVTGSASNGEEAVAAFEKGAEADVMVLDINMPKMNGYETAEKMRTIAPGVKILFLTMIESDYALAKALQLGAKGIAKKDIPPDELQDAIRTVAKGQFYYCSITAEHLADLFKDPSGTAAVLQRLDFSEKELEFIRYAGTDMGYKEIAGVMKVEANVLDNIRYAVMDKAGVKTRNALVMFGVKNGLIHY